MGLSLRLLRLGGRRAWTAAGLMGAGVAVGTLLLAVAVGALHGWDARESRTGWRPAAQGPETTDVPASAVALVRTTSDRVAGQPLQVVDVAAVGTGTGPADVPPGLPHVPAPGELWVSPALAELLRELPADRLADRFGGVAPTGTIAAEGLRDPAELVAVRGAAAPLPGGAALDSFAGSPLQLDEIEVYRQLTVVAVVLMGVPAVGLLGAAARLSAARRVRRLAALRLLGAGTGQVTVVAVAEVAVVATAAAVAGAAAQWALAPALAAIELGGSGWYADDLRPSPVALLVVVAAVALLATLAAVGGTRQVVVGPLGVAKRDRPGGARLVRLLGVVAAVAVFAAANAVMRTGSPDVAGLVFGGGMLALFGAASLVGPLVVRLCGRAMARSARTPAVLLAGRRLLDDPKGAFRPLAGLTLAVFVAGFLAPLTATVSGTLAADDVALRMDPRDGRPAVVAEAVQRRLADQELAAEVTTTRSEVAVVPGPGVDRDRVRTALAPLAPGSSLLTEAERDGQGSVLVGDLVRGALVVLSGTFVLAATSAGTTAAARVLDQRDTLRRLRLAGTPLAVLDAARRIETVRPLLVNAAIALALGLICAAPFVALTEVFDPAALVLLGSVLAVGLLLVVLASAASRPLLRAVTAERGGDE
ncbi:FtsX-like permease family protein [Pseudonocardia lacus]|uniref:FtsX-like permease family protein n=1 Tax=Pseudonocardia lacus TaxID=2835865 RepID=UPI001BDD32A4|nr:FtsX-like permease family protein [Pseudonocardia lacus]